MMKVTMKNEIRRIGATHLCMVSSERVRSHCYLYLCNRCKKVWVRACARMRQTLHSHTHFMTIRLIEQNFKWFISFGLFNWKYVALQFSHSFLIIIKSDGYRYCAATCFMSLTEKKKICQFMHLNIRFKTAFGSIATKYTAFDQSIDWECVFFRI